MHLARAAAIFFLLPTATYGEDAVQTVPLVSTSFYNEMQIEKEIIERVEAHVYDGYEAELCIEDINRCHSSIFEPYKTTIDGRIAYILTINSSDWDSLAEEVKNEVIAEIKYFTWGDPDRSSSPLDVVIVGATLRASPLMYLSQNAVRRYLRFATPDSLVGGLGGSAYGPNCWYSAIAAIADARSAYAQSQMLASASWGQARFMGPTEFRHHMSSFTQVTEPRFGDLIRYYTDEPIYSGLIYGGEVHAAVYVGKETYIDKDGNTTVREVALTKNGRSDLDFLMFQDIAALDDTYIRSNSASTLLDDGKKIKKGYFRVSPGASVLDPATAGRLSIAHSAFLVDNRNYTDRWLCLAKRIAPPEGGTCLNYPKEWMTLPPADQISEASEAVPPQTEQAPSLPPLAPTPPSPFAQVLSSG